MSEDRFLERLRGEARQLRYEPGDVAVTRVSARVRARIVGPALAEILAAWIRPLAASLSAIALAAAISLTLYERSQPVSINGDTVEVGVGGDVYSVVE
ncbi:MAG TPA: hypothetical protein VLV78_22950 [Thermoanaerobaculia bacterium]|nr:hypothetical protein [Thermoanaerobaculia bacterium]